MLIHLPEQAEESHEQPQSRWLVFQLGFTPSTFQVHFRSFVSCACLMYVICFSYVNWVKRVQYYTRFMYFTVICICLSLSHCVDCCYISVEYIALDRTQFAASAQDTACTLLCRSSVIISEVSQIICSSFKQLWDHCCVKEV